MFLRRLVSLPDTKSSRCVGGCRCPDILEMTSGDFAIIGTDITEEASSQLLAGSGCGPNERIVRIPRELLVRARSEIPLG